MINQGKITHEKIWSYLQGLAPYLTDNELNTLSSLFQLMEQDYTFIQSFENSKLQFVLEKEKNPYINQEIPSYPLLDDIEPSVKEMLIHFDCAKSHMQINELLYISLILTMIDEHQFTISLTNIEGKIVLKLSREKIEKNVIKFLQ